MLVERLRVADLDDAAEVHDRDPVGDLADHREVVRDEDVGEVELALEVLEQVEDLRLHRDVERRHRLVADDQLRLQRERARDADPLALAARELVRVAVVVLRAEARRASSSSWTRCFASFSVWWIANGSPMIWPTLLRGFSDEYGSWKIICISLPQRPQLALRAVRDVAAVEADRARRSARAGATIRRAVVDLPQPDSPTMPSVSPRFTVSDTSSTACTTPLPRANTPCLTGKCFVRCSTSTSGPSPDRARASGGAHDGEPELRRDPRPSRPRACARAREGRRRGGRPGSGRAAAASCRTARSGSVQRGWNGQPGGGWSSDGGEPSIGTQRVEPLLDRRHRLEQAPRVRVLRRVEDLARGPVLHRAAGVHHHHVRRRLGDDAEVVRDQDHADVELALDAVDQLEDLRLHRHVERGRRLVGDQHVRVVDERHRDHRALAHAARELVRVVASRATFGVRDPDRVEQLDGAAPAPASSRRSRARGRPRRSGRRRGTSGAGRRTGPGRSSRRRGRGPCAARPATASADRVPSNRISPVMSA